MSSNTHISCIYENHIECISHTCTVFKCHRVQVRTGVLLQSEILNKTKINRNISMALVGGPLSSCMTKITTPSVNVGVNDNTMVSRLNLTTSTTSRSKSKSSIVSRNRPGNGIITPDLRDTINASISDHHMHFLNTHDDNTSIDEL